MTQVLWFACMDLLVQGQLVGIGEFLIADIADEAAMLVVNDDVPTQCLVVHESHITLLTPA